MPVETEVTLVEVSPTEFREALPADWSDEGRYLADPAGQPWLMPKRFGRLGEVPVTAAGFVAWLEGRGDYESDEGCGYHLDSTFDRTPLAMPWDASLQEVNGHVLLSLEEAAQSALRAFLAENVRVMGESRADRRAPVKIPDETRERLLEWTIGAQFGLLPTVGLPAMLRESATVLDAPAEMEHNAEAWGQSYLARHIRGRVLPRIETAEPIPGDDIDALSGIGERA